MDDQRTDQESPGDIPLIPRDPARIDRITELLRELWHLAPDWRLGQLVASAAGLPDDVGGIFYMSDEAIEKKLQLLAWQLRNRSTLEDK